MSLNQYNLARLRGLVRPFRLHFFSRVGSTNDHAARMRRDRRLFAPALVVTSHQVSGRGRGENVWFSSAGNITATFAFPIEEHLAAHQIPLIAGLAVREAASALTGFCAIQVKWPNDLMFEGRKLAGLLCERIEKVDLIGVGLNVNLDPRSAPPALRSMVTSLCAIGGKPVDLTAALGEVARRLHAALGRRDETSFAAMLRDYDRHNALLGRKVSVQTGPAEPPITGRVQGIDSTGRLILKNRAKTHRVIAGHVTDLSSH